MAFQEEKEPVKKENEGKMEILRWGRIKMLSREKIEYKRMNDSLV